MEDSAISEEIIDEVSKATEMCGLPTAVGRAWGVLYFKGDMTQNELKNELKCSLSSVSQALTFLEKTGLIYTPLKKGRKQVYSAELSLQKIKRNQMENMLRFYLEPMCGLLNSRAEMVKNKELRAKINELKGLYSKLSVFTKIILKTPFGKK